MWTVCMGKRETDQVPRGQPPAVVRARLREQARFREDGVSRKQDGVTRKKDSVSRKQDNVSRKQDSVYRKQDNASRKHDCVFWIVCLGKERQRTASHTREILRERETYQVPRGQPPAVVRARLREQARFRKLLRPHPPLRRSVCCQRRPLVRVPCHTTRQSELQASQNYKPVTSRGQTELRTSQK